MKAIKFFAVAILFSGVSVISSAQVTATATASSTIVTPIGITKTVDMNFGNVAINSTTAGTVVLAPAGTRTFTGGVTLPATAGTVAAAEFNVTGANNYTFSITLPSTSHEIKSGSNTMSVTGFTSTPTPTGTLSATGSATVKVGATLNVSAGQAAGTYTSVTPFEVTVNYN
jgi:hypothetical protein